MNLLPANPLGDVLGRVDKTLGSVDVTIARVDESLEALRTLTLGLERKLEALDQLPSVLARLDEIQTTLAKQSAPADVPG